MKKLTSGVYFLYKGDELVYIGESDSIFSRVGTHIREGVKDFDTWAYHEIEGTRERKALEGFLISIYKPKYNEVGLNNESVRVHGENEIPLSMRRIITAYEEFQCWVDLNWLKNVFEVDSIDCEYLVKRKIIPESVVRTNERGHIIGFRRSWVLDNLARISMGIVQMRNDGFGVPKYPTERSLYEN